MKDDDIKEELSVLMKELKIDLRKIKKEYKEKYKEEWKNSPETNTSRINRG